MSRERQRSALAYTDVVLGIHLVRLLGDPVATAQVAAALRTMRTPSIRPAGGEVGCYVIMADECTTKTAEATARSLRSEDFGAAVIVVQEPTESTSSGRGGHVGAFHHRRIAAAGIDRFIASDRLDGQRDRLCSAIEAYCRHQVPATIRAVCDAIQSRRIRMLVGYVIRNGFCPLTVGGLATHFGVDQRTLLRLFRGDAQCSTLDMLRLGRITHVARLIDHADAPASAIARQLKFAGVESVYRLVRQVTSRTLSQLRTDGATDVVAALLRSRLQKVLPT